jgi:FkbM family methyltransferase
LGVLNETFLTLVHIVQSILRPGDTFIDIGANHGTYTIAAAYRVGSTGRVHAFEPQPRMASFIRSAITANGLQNVELREVALAEADGTASFFVADTRTGGLYEQFSGIGRGDARVLTVSTLNLDSLTDQLAIGASGRFVVKLDAEGSERGIVRGGKKFFSAHRPPILLEINPRSATAAGYTARDLLDELAAIGYTEGIELDAFTSSELAGIPLSELNATVERDVVIR